MNLTVSDYQELFSDFRKIAKAKTDKAKMVLIHRVKTRLKDAGAILKEIKWK